MQLTEAQQQQYAREGYIVIDSLISAADVEKALASISRIIANDLVTLDIERAVREGKASTPADKELCVRKLMGFTKVDEHLKYLAEHPDLLATCEALLGESVLLTQDMALLKPPHLGVEKPWHQDDAYFLIDPPEKVIGVWIALDEARVENGCMQVIPGSHLKGPQPHFHIRDCQIPDDRVDRPHAVPIPLKPGGALFFHGLLHHGTENNHSPLRRRALQYHYKGVNTRPMSPEEHGRLFTEDGQYAGCAGWAFPKAQATPAAR